MASALRNTNLNIKTEQNTDPQILRLSKGSELTWTEMDSNILNLLKLSTFDGYNYVKELEIDDVLNSDLGYLVICIPMDTEQFNNGIFDFKLNINFDCEVGTDQSLINNKIRIYDYIFSGGVDTLASFNSIVNSYYHPDDSDIRTITNHISGKKYMTFPIPIGTDPMINYINYKNIKIKIAIDNQYQPLIDLDNVLVMLSNSVTIPNIGMNN